MSRHITKIFQCSIISGVACQLVAFLVKLLCGALLAQLLTFAMGMGQGETLRLAALILILLATAALPLYFLNRTYNYAKGKDAQRFREWLYQALLDRRLDIRSRGELEVKLRRDTDTVVNFYEQACPEAVGSSVILLGSTVLLCWMDWRIGLLFFALDLLQLLPIFIYEKWMKKIHSETCQAEEDASAWILEGYSGAHILKSYGAQKWYLDRYHALAGATMHWSFRAESAQAIENAVFLAIDSLLNYGSYIILGLFVLFGGISAADLPMLIILSGYLFSSISSIFTLWIQRAQYQVARERLKPCGLEASGRAKDTGQGGVVLGCREVSKDFNGKTVLTCVSLEIRAGDHVLLQGKNGSGKSTLLRILLGLEPADSGTVERLSDGAVGISYALQEEARTELTVRELAEQLAQDPRIDGPALRRHLSAFSMEDTMEQPLQQLSGGQAKRFFLSAALAKNSPVLILDEPTNHLDQDSTAYLVQCLQEYSGTLVVCTHAALPQLRWSRVIRMEGGAIYEA